MEWERSLIHDTIVLRAFTTHDWESWGRTEFPAAGSVLEQIHKLRDSPPDPYRRDRTIDFARRNDDLLTHPPRWSAQLTGNLSEGAVESVAYGWPLRTVVCTGRLLVDPADRHLVKASVSDGLGSFSNPFVAAPAWGRAATAFFAVLFAALFTAADFFAGADFFAVAFFAGAFFAGAFFTGNFFTGAFFFATFFFVAMVYFSAVMNFTQARNCERIGASEHPLLVVITLPSSVSRP